jgi:hypothetical protein
VQAPFVQEDVSAAYGEFREQVKALQDDLPEEVIQ